MSRIPWRFVDPETNEQMYFDVNPFQDNTSNAFNRRIAYSVSAGLRRTSAGIHTIDNIIYSPGFDQRTFSYQGKVYNQTQLEIMETWVEKNYPLELWDDLGRGCLVYITDFTLDRERKIKNPYKHTYVLNGIILETL